MKYQQYQNLVKYGYTRGTTHTNTHFQHSKRSMAGATLCSSATTHVRHPAARGPRSAKGSVHARHLHTPVPRRQHSARRRRDGHRLIYAAREFCDERQVQLAGQRQEDEGCTQGRAVGGRPVTAGEAVHQGQLQTSPPSTVRGDKPPLATSSSTPTAKSAHRRPTAQHPAVAEHRVIPVFGSGLPARSISAATASVPILPTPTAALAAAAGCAGTRTTRQHHPI